MHKDLRTPSKRNSASGMKVMIKVKGRNSLFYVRPIPSGDRYDDGDINKNFVISSTYFTSFIALLKINITLFYICLYFFKVIKQAIT
jgi:hypothetical protein